MACGVIISGTIQAKYTTDQPNSGEVEVWRKRLTYSELLGNAQIDSKGHFYISLVLENLGNIDNGALVFFKYYDNEILIPYTLIFDPVNPVVVTETTIVEGTNNVTLYIDNIQEEVVEETETVYVTFEIKKPDEEYYFANQALDISLQYNGVEIFNTGRLSTDNRGKVSFDIPRQDKITYYDTNYEGQLDAIITYYDSDNKVVNNSTLSPLNTSSIFDIEDNIVVEVNLPVPSAPTSKKILDLSSELSIAISSNLSTYFTTNSINSLKDVRTVGGLMNQPDLEDSLYDPDRTTIAKLDSHANMELVSDDYTFHNYLIDNGYDSLQKVSSTSRSTFVKDTIAYGSYNEFQLARAHNTMSKIGKYLELVVFREAVRYYDPSTATNSQTIFHNLKQ